MARKKQSKPDHIMIGGLPWTIEYKSKLVAMEDADNRLHGETDVDLRIIRICTDYPPHIQLQTLWHECLHAALHVSGHSDILSPGHEESLVMALEHILYPIIPEIMARAQDLEG